MREFFFNLSQFFVDPVLRAPTIGCMLMCLAASLPGVFAYLRKESLLGESLSHATYPGIILGALCSTFFTLNFEDYISFSIFVLIGGFLSSLLGLWAIHFMEKKLKVPPDAALCFILASFFGVGLTLASRIQFTHTSLYKQMLTYFYGQAATMTDIYIYIYGLLALVMIASISFFYKELKITTLDREYAKSLGIPVKMIDTILFSLIALAVVIGIRSVGIVLMSAMLIAPAAASRQLTQRLSHMLILAALFGIFCGFLGNYFSVIGSEYLLKTYPQNRLSLPTGPMIVLVATFLCLLSLLFAPERGIIVRYFTLIRFRNRCLGENILKNLWHLGPEARQPFEKVIKNQSSPNWYLRWILWQLKRKGWVESKGKDFFLSKDGTLYAARIVRLHRLWEVYLADHLEIGVEKVHRNAEEMEHIITPELERKLTYLLKDPKKDPHQQRIPSHEEGLDNDGL